MPRSALLALAHGAGTCGPILEGLAACRTVVGIDHPGSGDTPAPRPRCSWWL
ncbi:hypothetical protein [Streptomyces sp. NPDC093060]|uniref:hypothetical protein n=1 Tax=Streptomyces sp. NPDC093060 TaxID=3366019 RepID=UPI0037F7FD3E